MKSAEPQQTNTAPAPFQSLNRQSGICTPPVVLYRQQRRKQTPRRPRAEVARPNLKAAPPLVIVSLWRGEPKRRGERLPPPPNEIDNIDKNRQRAKGKKSRADKRRKGRGGACTESKKIVFLQVSFSSFAKWRPPCTEGGRFFVFV